MHTPVLNPRELFVDALLTDVDGVHVKAKYDTTGNIEKGPDKDTDHHFELMKEYNKSGRNVPVILTSGRSLSQMMGIAKRSRNENMMIAEGGMIFYDPRTGTKSTIFEKIPEYQKYGDVVRTLSDMRNYLREDLPNILARMNVDGMKTDRIVMPEGKEAMVTIDLPYNGAYGGLDVPRVDRLYTLKVVLERISSDHRKMLYTKQEEFRELIPASDGEVEVHVDASAVNIRPPISKPDAIAHLIGDDGPLAKKYKITKVSQVGLVDDRDDQAMIKMYELGGNIYTVANASETTLSTVMLAYRNGGGGYISRHPDIRGFREILMKINPTDPWMHSSHRHI